VLALPTGSRVTDLTVRRPDGEFVLQAGDGNWAMTGPLASPADAANVNQVLDLVENMQASRIVHLGADLPERYTQAKDHIVVELTAELAPAATEPTTEPTAPAAAPAAPQRHRLNVVRLDNITYAWVEGQPGRPIAVGRFANSAYDTLASELRDRTLWTIDANSITGIEILAAKDQPALQLTNQAGRWTYSADPFVTIDAAKVAAFLTEVSLVKVDRYATHAYAKAADLKKYDLSEPWLVVKLTGAGRTWQIAISPKGPDTTGSRYAVSPDAPGVLVIPAETAASFARKLQDFKGS
jgi:hypothetical protein